MLIKQLRQSIAGKIPITVIHLQFGDELANLSKASRHLAFQGLKATDQPE